LKKKIAILGSTGSIGCQALEVIKAYPDRFEVEVLTAGKNKDALIRQAIEFKPNTVVIGEEEYFKDVSAALASYDIKVFCGPEAIAQVVEMDSIDIVLNALVGISGFLPTINAVKSGKTVALANKESLVVGGDLITKLIQEYRSTIIPVDSEHSAIYQCMIGEPHESIEKIILTASGGPFLHTPVEKMHKLTPGQALQHPNWNMGAKITIDSATMMNKGLEVIEAKWLFGLGADKIEVIVHPQSIVHSLVQFCDGSLKAQLGIPDMKIPIQYALTYPERLKMNLPKFSFLDHPQLTFIQPDTKKFRNLALAFEALKVGGNACCVLNAANEVAVAAFLDNKIGFLEISNIIENCLNKTRLIADPELQDYLDTDLETRSKALELIKQTKY